MPADAPTVLGRAMTTDEQIAILKQDVAKLRALADQLSEQLGVDADPRPPTRPRLTVVAGGDD